MEHSRRVRAAEIMPIDWSKPQKQWMRNTQILHDLAEEEIEFCACNGQATTLTVEPPWCVHALPHFLGKFENIGRSGYNGYSVPTLQALFDDAAVFAICLWGGRQWKDELREKVCDAIEKFERGRVDLCALDHRFTLRHVGAVIDELACASMRPFLNPADYHVCLSIAHRILTTRWFRDFLSKDPALLARVSLQFALSFHYALDHGDGLMQLFTPSDAEARKAQMELYLRMVPKVGAEMWQP